MAYSRGAPGANIKVVSPPKSLSNMIALGKWLANRIAGRKDGRKKQKKKEKTP